MAQAIVYLSLEQFEALQALRESEEFSDLPQIVQDLVLEFLMWEGAA